MSFYPQGYEPKEETSDYMRLVEGEHRFRILTDPIIGYEYWTADKKPVRYKTFKEAVADPNATKIKEFHGFIVWNYQEEKVMFLNITQKTIQKAIYNYTCDDDWADPTKYDIVIKRTGTGIDDTEYQVSTKLPKPLDEKAKKAFKDVKIVIDNYFNDGHPIVRDNNENATTKVMTDEESEAVADSISF